MKKILYSMSVIAALMGIWIFSDAAPQEINGDECMFLSGLHYTAKGMEHWHSKEEGGLERITNVPYSELTCKNCHVKSCDICHKVEEQGKSAYSTQTARNQDMCLQCHGRAKSTMNIDRKAKQEDVHFTSGMSCVDCHSAREMHGDGTEYYSMKQSGAMETRCENCHDADSSTVSHSAHEGKLDCNACHVLHVTSCTNCHFDTFIETGDKKSIPVSGWMFLMNYRGKVTSANMQTFVAKRNKTFLIFAPHMSHSVMKEGRKCMECHGTETVRQVSKGDITITWLKDGEVENLKGAIPVVEGVQYQCVYHDRVNDTWVPIEKPEKPLIQYPAFGEPLSRKQLESLMEVYEMPGE